MIYSGTALDAINIKSPNFVRHGEYELVDAAANVLLPASPYWAASGISRFLHYPITIKKTRFMLHLLKVSIIMLKYAHNFVNFIIIHSSDLAIILQEKFWISANFDILGLVPVKLLVSFLTSVYF